MLISFVVTEIYSTQNLSMKARGPKGPWIAHLWKRSKDTVEPFTEDHKCCSPNIKALVDFYKRISNSMLDCDPRGRVFF